MIEKILQRNTQRYLIIYKPDWMLIQRLVKLSEMI